MENPVTEERFLIDQQVDLTQLEESLDRECALELAQGFLEDVSTVATDLMGAIEKRDSEKLRRISHLLKGCCKVIMAEHTATLASKMESAAFASDWNVAVTLLPDLLESFDRTVLCLHDYLA